MPHPVVYPGSLNELVKKWETQHVKDLQEQTQTFIADGQCARLVQELTNVGYSGRWQPGERVIDVARTLPPGTVIANFKRVDGKLKFPREHGYHAAIFAGVERYSAVTGKATRIIMFDQWVGATPRNSHTPGTRGVSAYKADVAEAMHKMPCDNAAEFYVVLVP
jgi:hypothetical protein